MQANRQHVTLTVLKQYAVTLYSIKLLAKSVMKVENQQHATQTVHLTHVEMV